MTAILDKVDPIMERIVLSLLPFFINTMTNVEEAGIAIMHALASYGARTEAEMVEAAQVLGLGLAALKSLGELAMEGTSIAMRLRLRGNANALLRSKKHSQQALTDSLANELPDARQHDADPADGAYPDIAEAIRHARIMSQEARRQSTPLQTAPAQAAPPAVARPEAAPTPTAAPSKPAAAAPVANRPTAHPASAPHVTTPLSPQRANQLMWASAMGRVISEILPDSDPASAYQQPAQAIARPPAGQPPAGQAAPQGQ